MTGERVICGRCKAVFSLALLCKISKCPACGCTGYIRDLTPSEHLAPPALDFDAHRGASA